MADVCGIGTGDTTAQMDNSLILGLGAVVLLVLWANSKSSDSAKPAPAPKPQPPSPGPGQPTPPPPPPIPPTTDDGKTDDEVPPLRPFEDYTPWQAAFASSGLLPPAKEITVFPRDSFPKQFPSVDADKLQPYLRVLPPQFPDLNHWQYYDLYRWLKIFRHGESTKPTRYTEVPVDGSLAEQGIQAWIQLSIISERRLAEWGLSETKQPVTELLSAPAGNVQLQPLSLRPNRLTFLEWRLDPQMGMFLSVNNYADREIRLKSLAESAFFDLTVLEAAGDQMDISCFSMMPVGVIPMKRYFDSDAVHDPASHELIRQGDWLLAAFDMTYLAFVLWEMKGHIPWDHWHLDVIRHGENRDWWLVDSPSDFPQGREKTNVLVQAPFRGLYIRPPLELWQDQGLCRPVNTPAGYRNFSLTSSWTQCPRYKYISNPLLRELDVNNKWIFGYMPYVPANGRDFVSCVAWQQSSSFNNNGGTFYYFTDIGCPNFMKYSFMKFDKPVTVIGRELPYGRRNFVFQGPSATAQTWLADQLRSSTEDFRSKMTFRYMNFDVKFWEIPREGPQSTSGNSGIQTRFVDDPGFSYEDRTPYSSTFTKVWFFFPESTMFWRGWIDVRRLPLGWKIVLVDAFWNPRISQRVSAPMVVPTDNVWPDAISTRRAFDSNHCTRFPWGEYRHWSEKRGWHDFYSWPEYAWDFPSSDKVSSVGTPDEHLRQNPYFQPMGWMEDISKVRYTNLWIPDFGDNTSSISQWLPVASGNAAPIVDNLFN